MEKSQLVNFIGKMMENSGFKIYKSFKTSNMIIDIYGVLPTIIGDFGVVIACKNYDKEWNVGIEVLKDMEMVSRRLKASKVAIVTSSSFSSQAINYATRKNIKLIDREDLIKFAKKFSEENNENIPSHNNKGLDPDLEHNNSSNFDPRNTFLEKTNKGSIPNEEVRLSKPRNSPSTKNKNKLSSIFSKNKSSLKNVPQDTFNKPKKENVNYRKILKAILNNIIIMIAVVVILSYFIPYALEKIGMNYGRKMGIVKILLSLILSYGMVLSLNENKATGIIKGTIIFFISVAILIILIFVL